MTVFEQSQFMAAGLFIRARMARWVAHHAVAVFVVLSAAFGPAIVMLHPPLRAPDEAAHFVRAYGIARGDIIPSTVDGMGRKGIHLPASLAADFHFFEEVRHRVSAGDMSYRDVMSGFATRPTDISVHIGAPIFVLYTGSEGYSPIPYLPYAIAAFIARICSFDFVNTLYLMRFAGLIAFTAIIAYAIALVPFFAWTFVAVAMLPAALYGRAVISADGASLAAAMMVVALSLRGAARLAGPNRLAESAWMAACLLTKPPQIAFTLLALMKRPLRDSLAQWTSIALVTLPGMLLLGLWLFASAGDTGTWRYADLGEARPREFDPVWKLGYLLDHPGHFLSASLQTFDASVEIGKQMIGVLGWLETPLHAWAYPVLGLLLLAALFAPMKFDRETRPRVIIVALASFLAYGLAIFLVCYLAWTPISADRIHGVQGRYFIVVLPLVAVVLSAFLRRGVPQLLPGFAATLGAVIGGVATIEAILRVDWQAGW
jgi:predicted membrane protein DUF2142